MTRGLRELSRLGTIKVDLLPTEKKRFGIDPVMIFLVLIIIIFSVGFFVYGKTLEGQIAKKEEDVKKIDVEIQEIKQKLPGIQKMKDENAKLEAQIQTIKGLKNDPVRYANLLWELTEILPDNTWVTSISIDPNAQDVSISGSAVEEANKRPLETIAELMRNFQNSRYYRDATLGATSENSTPEGVAFSFSIDSHYDPDSALKSPDQIAPRGQATPSPAPAPARPAGAAPAASPAASPSAGK
jgi:Tfp pilus assembly protein PilN